MGGFTQCPAVGFVMVTSESQGTAAMQVPAGMHKLGVGQTLPWGSLALRSQLVTNSKLALLFAISCALAALHIAQESGCKNALQQLCVGSRSTWAHWITRV